MRIVKYVLPQSVYIISSYSRNRKSFADSCWKEHKVYSASWSQDIIESYIKWWGW